MSLQKIEELHRSLEDIKLKNKKNWNATWNELDNEIQCYCTKHSIPPLKSITINRRINKFYIASIVISLYNKRNERFLFDINGKNYYYDVLCKDFVKDILCIISPGILKLYWENE